MTLEPAEGDRIGDAVALDDVAQDSNINVALQERPAVADVEALSIGKAALQKISAEGFFERGSAGFRQGVPIFFRQKITMTQSFSEAEWEYRYFHGSPAHAGVNFATEHGGG